LTHHDHHQVFPAPDFWKIPGKKTSLGKPAALPHQVRFCQGKGQFLTVLGQKIGVAFGNMGLPLCGQFHLALEVRTKECGHVKLAMPFLAPLGLLGRLLDYGPLPGRESL
jgi:hypothetical protein